MIAIVPDIYRDEYDNILNGGLEKYYLHTILCMWGLFYK